MAEFKSYRTGKPLTERGAIRLIAKQLPRQELWEAGVVRNDVRLIFKAHPNLWQLENGIVLSRYVTKKNAREVYEDLKTYAEEIEEDIYI